jgi:hypothetical protein
MSLFQNLFDSRTRRGCFLPCVLVSLFAVAGWSAQELAAQARFNAVGPTGGDARSLTSVPGHPNHLFLGTTNSWIFESLDEGASWHRLAKLDGSDGLILDHIVVDPADANTMLVAAWKADRPEGGLWVSHDAGKSWSLSQGLHGQSIRIHSGAFRSQNVLCGNPRRGVPLDRRGSNVDADLPTGQP